MFAVSIRVVNKDGASRFTNTIDNRFAVIGDFTATTLPDGRRHHPLRT